MRSRAPAPCASRRTVQQSFARGTARPHQARASTRISRKVHPAGGCGTGPRAAATWFPMSHQPPWFWESELDAFLEPLVHDAPLRCPRGDVLACRAPAGEEFALPISDKATGLARACPPRGSAAGGLRWRGSSGVNVMRPGGASLHQKISADEETPRGVSSSPGPIKTQRTVASCKSRPGQ